MKLTAWEIGFVGFVLLMTAGFGALAWRVVMPHAAPLPHEGAADAGPR